MGWLDTALSVATTIGKIAGTIQARNGFAHFGPTGTGANQKIGQVIFWQDENSHIWAVNQSLEDGVGLCFPAAMGGTPGGQNLLLPKLSKFDITLAFNVYSLADVDQFVITPWKTNNPTGADNDDEDTLIQAQATNQPTNVEFALGSYMRIRVSGSERVCVVTVVGGLILTGIVLLSLRGAGSTTAQVSNLRRLLPATTNGDQSSMTIPIPAGVDVSNGVSSIYVTASVQGLDALVEDFVRENAGRLVPLTEEDHARIANYVED
ncbi:hypothetical protein HTZ77_07130 [Nonomuraea sp. SMC257]|uniref:Uncharacterized protein n=1 Tax=Nonomuraea montanisoli TaxID=2741721 RepID=A0A7Y6I504_9ACTN|nr:hypothetical protein [Nonomuraea montanisoli]NUW31193.1 hypothetical protein [Nonomuraea montanisoli]